MKYTEDNLQGVRFYTTDPKKIYVLDFTTNRSGQLPNGDWIVSGWTKESCVKTLEGGSWHVLEPLSNQVINNYSIY